LLANRSQSDYISRVDVEMSRYSHFDRSEDQSEDNLVAYIIGLEQSKTSIFMKIFDRFRYLSLDRSVFHKQLKV